jgi:hypothetical protein
MLAVGAAAFGANEGLGEPAPFSSEGLAFDGWPKPEVSTAGVGLATSDPGRDEDGVARYGTLSGSSAAAAVTAGAAALLAQARPDLDARGLKQALVAGARRGSGTAGGLLDPSRAAATELVAQPPALALGSALKENTTLRRRILLRSVSRRTLDVTVAPGPADQADIAVVVTPSRFRLKPGRSRPIRIAATVPLLPRAPAALGGVLQAKVRGGATLEIPWTIAVPLPKPDLLPVARLSSRAFKPSDAEPAVLTVVAGRVVGSAERPQLLPLRLLTLDLVRNGKDVGRLAQLRDVLRGRYSFGITGRGPRGRRLPAGPYELRLTAVPVGGSATDERVVRFAILK